MSQIDEFDAAQLPEGIRSGFVEGVNGLRMHVLEAGFDPPGRPRLLLLHGFPELAYSWRKVMAPLAAAGFHVLAPDQRGYGRTTGWDPDYDGDLASFRILNLVRDILALLSALGHRSVAAVVGHDFGSPVAAYCALARPDVFPAVALMSAPFKGPPAFPFGGAARDGAGDLADDGPTATNIDAALAALPRPRKHYQRYYGTRGADAEMRDCPQGLAGFLRAYFHCKSGDWAGNRPFRLRDWSAEALAQMPGYYIMDLEAGMAETVAAYAPSDAEVAACGWLTEAELQVYTQEFARTGFQGGLQWYRCIFDAGQLQELRLYSGRSIEVPACFIAGARDWGVYQQPGALEAMRDTACSRMRSVDLVPGAGHWVQQERPDAVAEVLLRFLASLP